MSVFSARVWDWQSVYSVYIVSYCIIVPKALDQVLAPGVPYVFYVDLINLISFLNLFEYFLIYEKEF